MALAFSWGHFLCVRLFDAFPRRGMESQYGKSDQQAETRPNRIRGYSFTVVFEPLSTVNAARQSGPKNRLAQSGATSGYQVTVPRLPGLVTYGRTLDEARARRVTPSGATCRGSSRMVSRFRTNGMPGKRECELHSRPRCLRVSSSEAKGSSSSVAEGRFRNPPPNRKSCAIMASGKATSACYRSQTRPLRPARARFEKYSPTGRNNSGRVS